MKLGKYEEGAEEEGSRAVKQVQYGVEQLVSHRES